MKGTAYLLSGRLLVGNVIWSLAGAGLPLLVGVWAIPELVSGLGKERFGLLAIIWMGIGYFSLFDLGIGRALTKLVSERLGKGRDGELSVLIRTGLRLMWWLGITAALLVAVGSPMIIGHVLQVPKELQSEGVKSFWLLASALPFVVSTAGLIGILQAHQRFRAITSVRLPLGVATFLGPIAMLSVTDSLAGITFTLVLARILAWAFYRMLCESYLRTPGEITENTKPMTRDLLTFGGWVTISNLIGPIMVYFDRLLIGAVLGLVAVAYYTTPYEIVTRLWVFPNAIADVIFPALTASLAGQIASARRIYTSAILVQAATILPLVVVITLYAGELLNIWLGPQFAENGAGVLRWLAVGVYINSMARLPFSLLQGYGRPDLTAKIHMVELPLYLGALWLGMQVWGIKGAAIAWTGRIALDTLILFVLAAANVRCITTAQHKFALGVFTTSAVVIAMWNVEGSLEKTALTWATVLIAALIALSAVRRFPTSSPERQIIKAGSHG